MANGDTLSLLGEVAQAPSGCLFGATFSFILSFIVLPPPAVKKTAHRLEVLSVCHENEVSSRSIRCGQVVERSLNQSQLHDEVFLFLVTHLSANTRVIFKTRTQTITVRVCSDVQLLVRQDTRPTCVCTQTPNGFDFQEP